MYYTILLLSLIKSVSLLPFIMLKDYPPNIYLGLATVIGILSVFIALEINSYAHVIFGLIFLMCAIYLIILKNEIITPKRNQEQ